MTAQAIKRVVVKNLFGTYDYELKAPPEAVDADRLPILYGDNGTGKTTILKTLFHLLSPEAGQGHKTALLGVPLSRIDVDFTTGERVWLRRKGGQLLSSYTLGMSTDKKKESTCEFVSEEGAIKASAKINAFLRILSNLNLAFYFLSDDRTVRLAGVARREGSFSNDEMFVTPCKRFASGWVKRIPSVPNRRDRAQQLRERHHLCMPAHVRTASGNVDAYLNDSYLSFEIAFDEPGAGRAMDAFEQQRYFAQIVIEMNDEPCTLGGLGMACRFILARGFKRAEVERLPATVKLIQTCRADRLRNSETTGAAKPALEPAKYSVPGRRLRIGLSAVEARSDRVGGRTRVGDSRCVDRGRAPIGRYIAKRDGRYRHSSKYTGACRRLD